MPQFYFRQYTNGQQMAKDQEGREFASLAEACTYAVRRAPGLLKKNPPLGCEYVSQHRDIRW
jgi:hypothetical protein